MNSRGIADCALSIADWESRMALCLLFRSAIGHRQSFITTEPELISKHVNGMTLEVNSLMSQGDRQALKRSGV